jgi:hypothetical protein
VEGPGGLLQVKQNATGALERDAIGGEGIPDFGERRLDIGKSFHGREVGAENIGAADNSGGILAAFMIAWWK